MTIFPRAKVQFLALKDEISDLLSKGYTVLDIHKMLTEENKISMSYFSLNGYINIFIHGKDPKSKKKKKVLSKSPQNKIISSTSESFGKKKSNPDENI